MTNDINWNGIAEDGRDGDFNWGTNDYTWKDIQLVEELTDGLGTLRRRREQYSWLQEWKNNNPEKTKQLVHLICRVKGEKVFDESKEIDLKNVDITLEDVDLVLKNVLNKRVVSLVCEVDGKKIKQKKVI